jgi:hypothetical protein
MVQGTKQHPIPIRTSCYLRFFFSYLTKCISLVFKANSNSHPDLELDFYSAKALKTKLNGYAHACKYHVPKRQILNTSVIESLKVKVFSH